jgi:hypothetical protein
VGTDGVGPDGVGSDVVGSDGVGPDGVGSDGVGIDIHIDMLIDISSERIRFQNASSSGNRNSDGFPSPPHTLRLLPPTSTRIRSALIKAKMLKRRSLIISKKSSFHVKI